MFNFLQLHGLWFARLLSPWISLGKITGVGSHSLLQGIFPSKGSNLDLLHCRWILYHLTTREGTVNDGHWGEGMSLSRMGGSCDVNPGGAELKLEFLRRQLLSQGKASGDGPGWNIPPPKFIYLLTMAIRRTISIQASWLSLSLSRFGVWFAYVYVHECI